MRRALFHCNYCNKDITNTIRVKCAVCPDFDLCLECFSVGAEVHPHKRSHAYRVVDNLSFPLFTPDWGVRLSRPFWLQHLTCVVSNFASNDKHYDLLLARLAPASASHVAYRVASAVWAPPFGACVASSALSWC